MVSGGISLGTEGTAGAEFRTWLCVGVLSWGVMFVAASSSDELSSSRPSNSS